MAGLDLDASGRAGAHRKLIETKPFLRRVYAEWGEWLSHLDPRRGPAPSSSWGSEPADCSRTAFAAASAPTLVYSDSLDLVLDGQRLPFAGGVLRGIAMTNVFHHLPEPRRFLAEAARAASGPGGRWS